ncbi:MAG: ABC transporter permease subunit, partial [Gibbsiella quercinecans]
MTTLTEVTRKSRWSWKLWRPGPLWLALPGIVFLLLFLMIPSLKIFMLSVVNNQGQFSLAGFERFFTHGVYQRVLVNTFDIAFWTTVFSLLLGYPLAYWLSNLPERAQKILSLLILLAFWSSTLVKNFT